MLKSIVFQHSKFNERTQVTFVREHRVKTYVPSIQWLYLLEDMLNTAAHQDLTSIEIRTSRLRLEVSCVPHDDLREYQFDGVNFWNKK